MKLLAGILLSAIVVALIVVNNSHDGGLSGFWDEMTQSDGPEIAKIEQDIELDVSTP